MALTAAAAAIRRQSAVLYLSGLVGAVDIAAAAATVSRARQAIVRLIERARWNKKTVTRGASDDNGNDDDDDGSRER